MHLREAGQAVAGGVLGADQLIPLLEPLIVQARPLHGWTLLARMQALGEQELFDKPDLASAVDGWESACVGVESQAPTPNPTSNPTLVRVRVRVRVRVWVTVRVRISTEASASSRRR